MNRKQLAHLFARVSQRSPARAADILDKLVYRLIKELKRPFARPPSHRSTAAGSTEARQTEDKQERQ